MENKIAVLLTCHNRADKTLRCLESFYAANLPRDLSFTIFLVDDGCIDGTAAQVKQLHPNVKIIYGNGSLYWAGGMRLAWKSALAADNFDGYLLLNDDVQLNMNFFDLLTECHDYAIDKYGYGGLYSACTLDESTNKISYGGQIIWRKGWRVISSAAEPDGRPKAVDTVNANILYVDKEVVKKIGILSERFTHSIADYDYGLRAKQAGFPVLLASSPGGLCVDDHGRNYLDQHTALRERIAYLKSPTGLACSEYLYYIRSHFPTALPYAIFMLWAKTLLPHLWRIFKK